MAAALRTIASQNFLTSSSGSFLQICSGFLFRVSANDTDTGTFSFSKRRSFVGCRRLLASSLEIVHDGVWKGSRFLFQINWLFMEIVSPHSTSSNPASRMVFFLFSVLAYYTSLVNFRFPFSLPAACRLFSRGVIFTRARVSLALLPLRKNGRLLVVYGFSQVTNFFRCVG